MTNASTYDLVFVGSYTKDTVVSSGRSRVVDGGGFNYGAHAAVLMGLKTAAVTRLAAEDVHVVKALVDLGVDVFPTYTPHSTHLTLYYPTSNVDERVISVMQTAGSFTPGEVRDLDATAFIINTSLRGEAGEDVVLDLKSKKALLAADAQGFIRAMAPDGTLAYAPWPQKKQVLAHFDILKTDAVEAEALTGLRDIREAAAALAGWGPKEIVLTHRDGLLVLAAGAFHEAPWCPKELVGRSGRGDTCLASYVGKRLSASPAEATVWAAALTSLKMEAEGPIKRSLAEVEGLVALYSA
ncbi:MAG: PfkB family carbohydrate kinase [Acidobacteriota bacterium]